MSPRRMHRRASAAALIAVAALAAGATSASAGVLVASAPSCDAQAVSQPFTPWLDYASYQAVPGGNFESDLTGWSTTGSTAIATGNESFNVGGASDAQSLAIPAGGSATSPAVCVGLEHPTLRFFAKRRSTGMLASLSTLRVDALVELQGGAVLPVTIGVVASDGSWQPTLPMAVVANLLPLLPGEHTPVAFRFSAVGGSFSVDDVDVDPYGRH